MNESDTVRLEPEHIATMVRFLRDVDDAQRLASAQAAIIAKALGIDPTAYDLNWDTKEFVKKNGNGKG